MHQAQNYCTFLWLSTNANSQDTTDKIMAVYSCIPTYLLYIYINDLGIFWGYLLLHMKARNAIVMCDFLLPTPTPSLYCPCSTDTVQDRTLQLSLVFLIMFISFL